MSKIKWEVLYDCCHVTHFAGTDSYSGHVTEYSKSECRAVVVVQGAPECKEVKWFTTIEEAKAWAISTLIKHAKSAIDEDKQAQEFLDLVKDSDGVNK